MLHLLFTSGRQHHARPAFVDSSVAPVSADDCERQAQPVTFALCDCKPTDTTDALAAQGAGPRAGKASGAIGVNGVLIGPDHRDAASCDANVQPHHLVIGELSSSHPCVWLEQETRRLPRKREVYEALPAIHVDPQPFRLYGAAICVDKQVDLVMDRLTAVGALDFSRHTFSSQWGGVGGEYGLVGRRWHYVTTQ
ncbi:unnamed protein product [Phytophthora lilii]|uniref:Unnamed protein product n=1 Tax=Phytophthora lilii TaxID=2077276 RepID=A0A9W6YJF7_9STRA|nr:unnamed protein product [Phytophthora lilii]